MNVTESAGSCNDGKQCDGSLGRILSALMVVMNDDTNVTRGGKLWRVERRPSSISHGMVSSGSSAFDHSLVLTCSRQSIFDIQRYRLINSP